MPMSILLYKIRKYSKNDVINFMEELIILKTVARVLECSNVAEFKFTQSSKYR